MKAWKWEAAAQERAPGGVTFPPTWKTPRFRTICSATARKPHDFARAQRETTRLTHDFTRTARATARW